MKRISIVLAAVALILGLSQCKKQEQSSINEENIVPITLDVRTNGGSRIDVNTANGAVSFETGDVVYVASGNKFVGTLTYNGATFAGNLTNPTTGEPLYFYFLGNKTPEETLTVGSSTYCSVSISDQTSGKLPVISSATSNETFTGAGLYTAYFLNKAALVKFNVTSSSTAATCLAGLFDGVNVDFETNSFTYSAGSNSVIKLPTGSGERWAIILPQVAMDEGLAYSEDGAYSGLRGTIPAIFENDYLTIGIEVNVTTVNAPLGAINGKFTINSNGDQVYFSKGNLQYIASTNRWRFANNQYDYIGDANSNISSTYHGWIDLFGWGTSGYNHGAICYQPWSTSMNYSDYYAYGQYTYNLYDQTGQADWGYNAIVNGGNIEGQWRTLTNDEWHYVINSRPTLSGIRYAMTNLNGVNGVVLLPDDWDDSIYELNDVNGGNYESNIITAADWTNTLEANGAVFLPATGLRMETSVNHAGSYGYYWSSSCGNFNANASYLIFYSDHFNWFSDRRYIGCSVRLVHSAE